MRRRGHPRKSRRQGAGFARRSHRCDCEALLRGRTSPGRQKTPATRSNHGFRQHAPVPRPVAPAEVPTLVLPTTSSRGRYSHWYSPIGINAPVRRQTWSVRLRIATPAIRVTVGDQTCIRSGWAPGGRRPESAIDMELPSPPRFIYATGTPERRPAIPASQLVRLCMGGRQAAKQFGVEGFERSPASCATIA
jgi:hypothetical protein